MNLPFPLSIKTSYVPQNIFRPYQVASANSRKAEGTLLADVGRGLKVKFDWRPLNVTDRPQTIVGTPVQQSASRLAALFLFMTAQTTLQLLQRNLTFSQLRCLLCFGRKIHFELWIRKIRNSSAEYEKSLVFWSRKSFSFVNYWYWMLGNNNCYHLQIQRGDFKLELKSRWILAQLLNLTTLIITFLRHTLSNAEEPRGYGHFSLPSEENYPSENILG